MLPGIQFTVEALRIDRTRERVLFRVLFVLLFFFRYWSLTSSVGDRDFTPFLEQVRSDMSLQEGMFAAVSRGNLLTLGISIALFAAAVFISLFYAGSFVTEIKKYPREAAEINHAALELIQNARETYRQLLSVQEEIRSSQQSDWDSRSSGGKKEVFVWRGTVRQREKEPRIKDMPFRSDVGPARNSLGWMVKQFFPLLLYFGLGLVLFVISLPLFSIPFIVSVFMFLFVPFYLLQGYSLEAAFSCSRSNTNGVKLLMFLQSIAFFFAFSLTASLIATVFEGHYFSISLLDSFLFSVRTLASGRLWALLFLVYADLVRRKGRFPSSQL